MMRGWGLASCYWLAIISIGLFSDGSGGGVEGSCLQGDIIVAEGESMGYIGLECVNETSFDASVSTCGADGVVVRTEEERRCPFMVPYCVQCGSRGWGAALCLSTPTTDQDCADDPQEDITNTTTGDDTSVINAPEDATKCKETRTCESCVELELADTLEESRKGCAWLQDGGCTLLELELSSPANTTNETGTSSIPILNIADCPIVGTRGGGGNITSSGPSRMATSPKGFIQGVLSLSAFLFMY